MTNEQMAKCRGWIAAEESKGDKISLARAAEMRRHFSNAGHDSGAFGRVAELASHTNKSRKAKVATQGKADTSIKLEVNGKTRYVAAEVKTNGGRIASLYAKGAPKFVIYSLDFVQKHKACKSGPAWEETRHVDPVIMPTDMFLALLVSCNAIKSTNGTNPEPAIQVSSKRLFERLLDWPIPYEPDTVYTPDDFDGVEC